MPKWKHMLSAAGVLLHRSWRPLILKFGMSLKEGDSVKKAWGEQNDIATKGHLLSPLLMVFSSSNPPRIDPHVHRFSLFVGHVCSVHSCVMGGTPHGGGNGALDLDLRPATYLSPCDSGWDSHPFLPIKLKGVVVPAPRPRWGWSVWNRAWDMQDTE